MENFYNNFSSYTKLLFSVKIIRGKFHIIISFPFSTTTHIPLIRIQKPPVPKLNLSFQFTWTRKVVRISRQNQEIAFAKWDLETFHRYLATFQEIGGILTPHHWEYPSWKEANRCECHARTDLSPRSGPSNGTRPSRTNNRYTSNFWYGYARCNFTRQWNDGNVFSREKSWKYRLRRIELWGYVREWNRSRMKV